MSGREGAFRYTGIAPGTYILSARVRTEPGLGRADGSGPVRLWATERVTVGGENLVGITLVLKAALRVAGRIELDAVPQAPAQAPAPLRVVAHAPNGESAGAMVGQDGSFDISGLLPGDYSVQVTPADPDWWLRSAIVKGRDVLDGNGLELTDADVNGMVLTYTNWHSRLSGTLESASGAPVDSDFVVVFPVDPALWHEGSRRMRSARPATDGQFTFRDLPAGRYLIAAVADVDAADWQTVQSLTALAASAVRVQIVDGQQTIQNLRIAVRR
jgi:hypothetical protein